MLYLAPFVPVLLLYHSKTAPLDCLIASVPIMCHVDIGGTNTGRSTGFLALLGYQHF